MTCNEATGAILEVRASPPPEAAEHIAAIAFLTNAVY
jgi:hypothetical protein